MRIMRPAFLLALALAGSTALAQDDSVPIVLDQNGNPIPNQPQVPNPNQPRNGSPNQVRPAQPKAPPRPKAAPKPTPKPKTVIREPVQVLVPDSRKGNDQREYEVKTQKRLDDSIQAIEKLKSSFEGLPEERREAFLGHLQMAEGNRSAARTKFKQMKYINPSNWLSITRGIDQAIEDLESSIQRANDFLQQKVETE